MSISLFFAPLVVSLLSAGLAFLIAVLDKVVNNYGQVSIDINGGKRKLSVKGGAPLLSTLAEQQIFVPSACGGRGSCGACKCKVTSDVGPHLPTETPYLTTEEKTANVRLACQIKLKKDIAIEIPEALFNIRLFKGTVEKIRDLTYDIKEVLVRLEDPPEVSFTAGQYGQFEVPAYDKIREKTSRAYSMSSRPADKNHLEFIVRLVPGGVVTTYVFKHLKQGELLRIVAPVGDFHVRDTDAIMLCVAGGSGMAPFKSIFNDMIDKGKTRREIWFFFGARSKRDLFYVDELEDIRKRYGENFHYIPALSEPQPGDDWKGETGLITQVLDRYIGTKIDATRPREGYLCGSPGMLDACIAVMRKQNVAQDNIFFDKFA
jgi:Na+-transporting NADH:ubiquinone oxidoreductase subunit F